MVGVWSEEDDVEAMMEKEECDVARKCGERVQVEARSLMAVPKLVNTLSERCYSISNLP